MTGCVLNWSLNIDGGHWKYSEITLGKLISNWIL
jgi:hypothetical protein